MRRPMKCLHCGLNESNAPRGLCRKCWKDRAVRFTYRRVKGSGRPHSEEKMVAALKEMILEERVRFMLKYAAMKHEQATR